MGTIKLSFLLAEHFAKGLADGTFERVGGIVRDVASKQPAVWLREVLGISQPILPNILSPAWGGILNLAISTMGFAVVMNRLSMIERRVKHV